MKVFVLQLLSGSCIAKLYENLPRDFGAEASDSICHPQAIENIEM
jgi:hypothetical protein